MTYSELREKAKDQGLKIPHNATKAQLQELVGEKVTPRYKAPSREPILKFHPKLHELLAEIRATEAHGVVKTRLKALEVGIIRLIRIVK